MGVVSLSLSLSHTLLSYAFISLHVANTFRLQTQLTSLLFPPSGPELLAHRHSTSKLISRLVPMIKQYVSEVLALLTCVMRLTAVHTWQWHWLGQSAQQGMCVFEILLKTWLDTSITASLLQAEAQDQFSPLKSKCRLWILPIPHLW